MWPLALALLTLLVLALPLAPALLEWRRQRDVGPLPIDGEHTLDVGAVAAGFRALLAAQPAPGQAALAATDGSLAPLLSVTGAFVPSPAEAALRLCTRAIVGAEAVLLPDDYAFSRDIYGRGSIRTGQRNRLQGLLSDGDIVMGAGSELQCWAHASDVRVGERCHLLGPVGALQSIRLEPGCRFASVSAPVIRFGRAGGDDAGEPTGTPASPRAGPLSAKLVPGAGRDGRWLVAHDFTFPPNRLYHGDLVVHGDLRIGAGAHIAGSVKASGNIRLGAGAGVDGALIAGAAISVERGCAVGGPVAAEGEVQLAPGSVIGAPDRPTTVVAPVLSVRVGATVYGAASALELGRVEPDCHAATAKDSPCPS
ncbi:polymer-forming cytoskeletal protein [Cupriavidus necator]|uniref:polymer-forming cytoskeletal protein n=1 Tax=Cupriavidus necator TaxID=106590 RepID=UPI0027876EF8|nr:polymer-forming cytoskeletal protein [Cupriavidus necator]MDQ0140857.1 cytoskeletal protein CcmA (bactofilin family) [Cupriavidus necator]